MISRRELAEMIVTLRREGVTETAAGTLLVHALWSVHETGEGVREGAPDLTAEEVDRVYNELPTSLERERDGTPIPEGPSE